MDRYLLRLAIKLNSNNNMQLPNRYVIETHENMFNVFSYAAKNKTDIIQQRV